jgi:hypothetical protein
MTPLTSCHIWRFKELLFLSEPSASHFSELAARRRGKCFFGDATLGDRSSRRPATISAMLAIVAAVSHAWRFDAHAIWPHLSSAAISHGRRRPHRGRRRPHPQASSTNGASMPSPLHAVMAAWAAPFLRICGLGVAHAPRHFGCVRSPPCPLISAPRIYHADARARRFSLCKAAAARARARRRSRRRLLG